MPISNNNNNNNNSNSKSSSTSSNKKAKTNNMSDNNNNSNIKQRQKEEKMQQEFRNVRAYILACPHVTTSNHPAVKAALHGLDQELKRMERDAKLQKKFTAAITSSSSGNNNNDVEEVVMVANPSLTTLNTTEKSTATTKPDAEDDQTDDWQDLAAAVHSDDVLMETADDDKRQDGVNGGNSDDSFLGDRLSAEVIRLIAQQHSVTVQTPLAAIALALHAAMRSTVLGFACTGIPEDEKASSNGGFAPPVRELPATQLLPPNWEKHGDSSIALRYRKKGTGSVVLQVVSSNNNNNNPATSTVQVTLVPSVAPEPPSESLSFALADHVNLDSFARASSSSRNVPPALHYKALSSLLTKFCTAFDLGSVHGDGDDTTMNNADKNMPYVDTSIQHYPTIVRQEPHLVATGSRCAMQQQPPPPQDSSPKFTDEPPPPQFPSMISSPKDPRLDPPTIESAFPALRDPSRSGSGRRGGDFDMDKGLPGMGAGVMPGGDGSFGGLLGDPTHSGNLMGPNHPIFTGSGVGGAPANYLVPRYDPVFGPPGGPGDVQDPNNPLHDGSNRFRPRGGGGPIKPNFTGNPNPDHFPPPGGSGHDMFS